MQSKNPLCFIFFLLTSEKQTSLVKKRIEISQPPNSVLRRRREGREGRQAPPRVGAHGRKEEGESQGRGRRNDGSSSRRGPSGSSGSSSNRSCTRTSSRSSSGLDLELPAARTRGRRRRRPQLDRARPLRPRLEPRPRLRRQQGALPRPRAHHPGADARRRQGFARERGEERRCCFVFRLGEWRRWQERR